MSSGAWKSFYEIEDNLTIDELFLCLDSLRRRDKEQFRMMAAVQGIEVPDDPEDIPDKGDDDLPPELLEMERKFQEIKKRQEGKSGSNFDDEFKLGHEISPFPIQQLQ